MALLHCEFFGQSINKMSGMDILFPEEKGKGPFPVLYLLHGLCGSQSAWPRGTNIERYVTDLPLIVVMPDGHRGFYVNAPSGTAGLKYEDHIVKDVVGFVDSTFHTIASRKGRALAGLSMGGYGSLMLAMRHPDKFCAASAMSGPLAFGASAEGVVGSHKFLLGDNLAKGTYNLAALASKVVGKKNRPAVRFDCGTEDDLIPMSRDFRAHLKKIKYPHIYKEYPGVHDWAYWDAHVGESVDFAVKQITQARAR
jgi:S-formylglutathione hydrolase FrmB